MLSAYACMLGTAVRPGPLRVSGYWTATLLMSVENALENGT